jgi:serine/threonine-protein kinase
MATDPLPETVQFGPFELDRRSGHLYKSGIRVRLQDQPLQVLTILLERPGEMVTREELRRRLWPADTYVDFEQGLNAAVKRLRRALGDSADVPRFVETLPRHGYRFIAALNGTSPFTGRVPRSWSRPSAARAAGIGLGLVAVAMTVSVWLFERSKATLAVEPSRITVPGQGPPVRFSIDVEETGPTSGAQAGVPGQLALCPNGHCVVYRGAQDGVGWLYLRSFDQLASTILPGTEGAHDPFFSPDGRWLGFFADGHLKKISLDLLEVRTLCHAPTGYGGSWAKDGTIYFAATPDGSISAVSSDGGVPRPATTLQAGEISHRWPLILPGADRLLYESMDSGGSRIVAQSLSTSERTTVVERGEYPRLAASGHLLFAEGDTVRAAPFDLEAARVIGPDAQLLPAVSGRWAAGRFDVALDGTLAYVRVTMNHIVDGVLFRVDRSGRATPLTDLKRGFAWPRFSPDGQKLAVTIGGESGGSQIWVYDLQRRSLSRLTFDGEVNRCAIWAPDGRRIVHQSIRSGSYALVQRPVDGSASAESLLTSRLELWPGSWSPDGRALAFQEVHPVTNTDIGILALTKTRKRTPFVNSSFGEWDGLFSPDGRLIAYTSLESERLEVYVRRYPGPGAKRQVSNDGGNSPLWAHSGKELFYLNGQKMMVVPIHNGADLTIGTPRLLFEGQYAIAGMLADFDVTPDDRAFVMIRSEQAKKWVRLNVALNWFEEIERRAPHPH